jgi:hypothetical protein
MYYDTRPSGFNGAFDYYTLRPLKGYYPLYWYGSFYDLESEVRGECDLGDIYYLCGVDKDGRAAAMITYYSDYDKKENVLLNVILNEGKEYDVYLLDEEHNGTLVATTSDLKLDMSVHSCIMLREK